jgi:hypothetical protein
MKLYVLGFLFLFYLTPLFSQGTDGLVFTLINGNAYGVSKGSATAEDVVIPSSYNGLPVIKINNNGFLNYTTLKTIYIPNTITEIGNYAFQGCNILVNLNMPNSIIKIGDLAFRNCRGLENINFSTSLTEIGEYAFSGCSSLYARLMGSPYPML